MLLSLKSNIVNCSLNNLLCYFSRKCWLFWDRSQNILIFSKGCSTTLSESYSSNKKKSSYIQARIRGGTAGPPPLPKKKKKEGRKGKERKEKEKGKEKRDIKKLRRHNLFFCAYRGLHWPMGGAGGSRPNKRRGNIIEKYAVFMHQKL